MKLLGKKAIVTGANRSIGKAIALAFAREGADILISYRSDAEGANQTIQEINRLGRLGKALYADFLHPQDVVQFFKQGIDFLGSLDILVNNAAAYNTTPFLDLDIKDFEYLFKINVSAPLLLSQLAAKFMINKDIQGKIINISSISGERPYPSRTAHSSAKAALNMMTKNIALELAPYQIRVNAIAPGSISEGEKSDEIPLQRMGTPEDQAHAALYLASEDSAWLTGQILTIDGGQSLSF